MLLAAPADGYTLIVTGVDPFADNFFLLDTNYKREDLTPISFVHTSPAGIITQPDRAWNTLRDAFEEAKAKDLTLRVGFMNARQRIIMENLGKKEGVKMSLVPMQGGPPTVTAVMGNHIDMGVVGSILVEYTKAGSIKTLAVMGDERMTRVPDVSTLQEQGFEVSYDIPTVLFTKAGVPDAIVNRLSAIMEKIAPTPAYTKVIIDQLNAEVTPPGREYAVKRLHRAYNNVAKDVGKPLLP